MTIALTVVPSDAALLFRRRYFVSGMSTVVLTRTRLPYLWLGRFLGRGEEEVMESGGESYGEGVGGFH
jgi:hypothetical protein